MHSSFLPLSGQLSDSKYGGKNEKVKKKKKPTNQKQTQNREGKGNDKYYFSAASGRTFQTYSPSAGTSNRGTISLLWTAAVHRALRSLFREVSWKTSSRYLTANPQLRSCWQHY